MMKKLIIFFCGTLALTACGNGIEKKANEKLTIARAAYERGDYEEAKRQYQDFVSQSIRGPQSRSGIDAGCGTQGSTRDSGLSGQCSPGKASSV